jgi:choline dehydrogenase-like flavoprotein
MSYYGASRIGWWKNSDKIGDDLKKELQTPGVWYVGFGIQGETIPVFENHVRLSADQKDAWDIPQVIISVGYSDNDEKMSKDFMTQAAEMLDKAGCKNITANDNKQAPGLDIHEMGGCRMGKDPKTSILNKWNQVHTCKNVFVTDGAAMTSVGNQNPSLTFMALTARAANFAIDEMKRGNL